MSAAVLAPIASGLVLVASFLLWERQTRHLMLPLPIFRSARFNVANTVSFCIYGSLSTFGPGKRTGRTIRTGLS